MSDIATETPRGYAPTGKNTGVGKPKGTSKIRAHEGVETIDISAVGTRRLSGHIYHLFNPQVIGDLAQLLHTGAPADERSALERVDNDGRPFWRLKE